MHIGQNSIASESSLPQLGQVRRGSVLIVLAALQPQPEPKATPRSTEWCESGQHSAWHSVVAFHKRMRYITALNHVSEQNSCRWCPVASGIANELRRCSGPNLTAVHHPLSTSPEPLAACDLYVKTHFAGSSNTPSVCYRFGTLGVCELLSRKCRSGGDQVLERFP